MPAEPATLGLTLKSTNALTAAWWWSTKARPWPLCLLYPPLSLSEHVTADGPMVPDLPNQLLTLTLYIVRTSPALTIYRLSTPIPNGPPNHHLTIPGVGHY